MEFNDDENPSQQAAGPVVELRKPLSWRRFIFLLLLLHWQTLVPQPDPCDFAKLEWGVYALAKIPLSAQNFDDDNISARSTYHRR